MTKHPEQLPRPAAELERLAEYYDTHDTSTDMDNGDWVEPQPMATTSLRLPADVIDQLKQQARTRHVRYTTHVRSILERAARSDSPPELAEITERLERIERALSGGPPRDDQKTASRTSARLGLALKVSAASVGVVALGSAALNTARRSAIGRGPPHASLHRQLSDPHGILRHAVPQRGRDGRSSEASRRRAGVHSCPGRERAPGECTQGPDERGQAQELVRQQYTGRYPFELLLLVV
jgi:hypothetical protein